MELNLMSKEETDRLAELEKTIEADLKGFVRVGMALKEIRKKRLYRSKYTTWKDYLKAEWDISKGYGDYQIAAADVVKNLEANANNCWHSENKEPEANSHNCGNSDFILPKNEAQARPLTLLSPEQQPEAWKEALGMTGGKVTALAVTKVVQEILELQIEDEKQGIQERIVKEITVPDDFSDKFSQLVEILAMHRKSGWKEFNRKKALEFIKSIEEYLNS